MTTAARDSTPPTMMVRRMAAGDLARVAELSGQLGYPSTPAQIEERFRVAGRDPDAALLVAEADGGTVVAWMHVLGQHLLESDPYAVIGGLVVDSGARRRGAGRALVHAAERWAVEHGYGAVRVRSNVARGEARPFYERLGYEITKTQHHFRKMLK